MSGQDTQLLAAFAQELTAQGKLIEAGWVSLRIAAISEHAPQIQLDGELLLNVGEAQVFAAALHLGAEQTRGRLQFELRGYLSEQWAAELDARTEPPR